MNLLYKIGGCTLLSGLLIAGALHYRQSLINDGVNIEASRRDKIVNTALIAANAKTKKAQSQVTALQGELSKLQSENQSEQTASVIRESALRSGAERLRAEFIAHRISEAGPPGDPTSPALDSGTIIDQDLSPKVAGNLEAFRRNENNAIDRLNACIVAYDKVKSASDELNK